MKMLFITFHFQFALKSVVMFTNIFQIAHISHCAQDIFQIIRRNDTFWLVQALK